MPAGYVPDLCLIYGTYKTFLFLFTFLKAAVHQTSKLLFLLDFITYSICKWERRKCLISKKYQENEDFSGSNMAIFSKSSIIDVWEHPKYASVLGRELHSQQFKRVVKYQLFLERICRPCVNFISVFSNDRSSHPEVFCKKGILKNFAELTGK